MSSYAIDPYGKKVSTVIKNGQTFTEDGKRIGAGYTVQTQGGIYKMGADGKGVKVDSHNAMPVVNAPKVNNTAPVVNDPRTSIVNNLSGGKANSFAYDPSGKKVDTYIQNGLTYNQDGSRLGAGYTAQTQGGIYQMGADGKGVKVDSHNGGYGNTPIQSTQTPSATGPTVGDVNNKYGFTDDVLALLKGVGSGKTAKSYGYDRFYEQGKADIEKRYDMYANSESPEAKKMAEYYKGSLDRHAIDYAKHNLNQTDFGEWDSGLLDQYIQNKMDYETLQMTTKTHPFYSQQYIDELKANVKSTPKQIADMNAQLRNFYGMKEDKYSGGDLGTLKNNLTYGNFLQHGLSKEANYKDIPAIGSTDDNYDPKFEMARMLSRRDSLHGYEPLGYAVGDKAQDRLKANSQLEYDMVNKMEATAGTKEQFGALNEFKNNAQQENIIPININDPSQGSIIESPQGRMLEINGQRTPLSDEDYVRYMSSILGF